MAPKKTGELKRAWKVKDYAEAKRLSTRTVWRMIAAGDLKIKRYSKRCIRVVDDNEAETLAA